MRIDMVTLQSFRSHWLFLYTALILIVLLSLLAEAIQIAIIPTRIAPNGPEANVSKNITIQFNVTSNGSNGDHVGNISVNITYSTGFLTFANSSHAPNNTADGSIAFIKFQSTTDEINITNSSFIFNVTWRVRTTAKDLNFTITVNASNSTTFFAWGNQTNISYNLTPVVFFSNYSTFSTNFTSFAFNVLGIVSADANALGPLLANANGSINFTRSINVSEANFDLNTIIGTGFVAVNQTAFDYGVNGTNMTAFIRLYNVSCPVRDLIIVDTGNITNNIDLYRSQGRDCKRTGECTNITCEAGDTIVGFRVSHFSAFVANGNANLSLNNSNAPPVGRGTGLAINFTVNYTNASNGIMANGSCNINLSQGSGSIIFANMSQLNNTLDNLGNQSMYFFNFTPNRTQIGLFQSNVSCKASFFTDLFTNLTYNVTDNVPPQVVNQTPIQNATFNQTSVINISAIVLEETGGYGIDKVFVNITFPNASLIQRTMTNTAGALFNFTFNISSLARGSYNFTIQANDTAGNLNFSVNASFFINDTTAPIVTNLSPTNVNISIGASINISVNVSDIEGAGTAGSGSGVNRVLINVTLPISLENIIITAVASGTADLFIANFSNTTQGGRYNYSIYSNDSYNNINATVSAFFVTNDTVAPSVSNLTPNANQTFNQTSIINISALISDNPGGTGIDQVLVNITFPNASSRLFTLTNNTFLFNFTFNETQPHAFGRYNITIRANDTSTNLNYTVNASFFINDTQSPSVINLSINNTNISRGQMINISVNFSDIEGGGNINGSGASVVAANITLPQSTTSIQVIMASTSQNLFIINFSNTTESGRYNITIDANDTYNNRNITLSGFFVQSAVVNNISQTNAEIANSTVDNATVINSNISNSNVNGTTVQNGTVQNSTVTNSVINRTVVENTTVRNSSLDESFVNQSQIDNSSLSNSTVRVSNINRTITDNSTIRFSNVTASQVNQTIVENSTIIGIVITSFINKSYIDPSNITNSSVVSSIVNDSIITNSSLLNVSVINQTINQSYVENSTLVEYNVTKFIALYGDNTTVLASALNKTTMENSSIRGSNATAVTLEGSNLTVVRATNSFIRRVNATHTEVVNSSVIDSSFLVRADTTLANAHVQNSTLLFVTSSLSDILGFNLTRGENITGAGNITFTCNKNNGPQNIFNVSLPGALNLPSSVYCSNLQDLASFGTTGIVIEDSSVNTTVGMSLGTVIRNGSISNVQLITNGTVINSFINDSTLNASNVLSGSNVTGSNLSSSVVETSVVRKSNISRQSIVNLSNVQNSTVDSANVTSSTVVYSNVTSAGLATIVFNSTILNSTALNSTIENSSVRFSVFAGSAMNRSLIELNTTGRLVDSNLTAVRMLVSNLTVVRATTSQFTRSNLTYTQTLNSTIIDSNILVVGNTTAALANIENSTLQFVTSTLSPILVFNLTRGENITGAGNISFTCNKNNGLQTIFNVSLPGVLNLPSTVYCSNLQDLASFGATGFLIADSSINTTIGIQGGVEVRNGSISNVQLITNGTVINSFINDSTLNASNVLSGSNVTGSNLSSSVVETSVVRKSNISRQSIVNLSDVQNSSVSSANVTTSVVRYSNVTGDGRFTEALNSTIANSTIHNSTVENSSALVMTATFGSMVNRSLIDNGTIVFSNVTASVVLSTNLTAVRAVGLIAIRSNITHTHILNSTIVDSALLENADRGTGEDLIDNSSLLNVIPVVGDAIRFNSTVAQNVSSISDSNITCNRRIQNFFNIIYAGTIVGVTQVFCSNLLNVSILPTGNHIDDSSINLSRIENLRARNASINSNFFDIATHRIINATIADSVVNNSRIDASNILTNSYIGSLSNITGSTVENSTTWVSNISRGSFVNSSFVDNSSIFFSNVTNSTVLTSNLTAVRAEQSILNRVNATHAQITNASLTSVSILARSDTTPDLANVQNSTISFITTTLSDRIAFNLTRGENITGAGNISFTCNQNNGPQQVFNVSLPGVFNLPSTVYCSNLQDLASFGTTGIVIEDSSVNTTVGMSLGTVIRNGSISNVALITNGTIFASFVNDSTLNASNAHRGSSIRGSNITSSHIENSTIFKSNISASSTLNSSRVDNSTITAANVTNSTIIASNITGTAVRTLVSNSTVRNSTVLNTTMFNSTVLFSVIRNSFLTRAFVDPSTITNSTVDGFSNVTDARIENSTLLGSNVTNATINASRLNGTHVFNANVTGSSVLINVGRVENVSLNNANLQDVPQVTDSILYLAHNTTTTSEVNVTQTVTQRLNLNNTMAFNLTNLTVTVLFDGRYLNYSSSQPQSLANNTNAGAQFANLARNFTHSITLGNVLVGPRTPGQWIEVNFTFVALRNHTNATVWFNVTGIRSDSGVRQFNTTLNITIVAPLPTDANLATAGFSPSEDNLSTNVTLVADLSNASGFRISNKNSSINWTVVNVIGAIGQTAPISNQVRAGGGTVGGDAFARALVLNTSAFHPSFNGTAIVTFYNVSCTSGRLVPVISGNVSFAQQAVDIASSGRDCISAGGCVNITCTSGSDGRGNLSFVALHFTSFVSSPNANLTITHGPSTVGSLITFNATYINATNGNLINGSTCNISVTDDATRVINMTVDPLTGRFFFQKTPSTAGNFVINTTCTGSGFTTLNAIDNLTLISVAGSGGVGGGGGGYSRRTSGTPAQTPTLAGPSTTGPAAFGPALTTPTPATPTPTSERSQTAFEVLDSIKAFYKGAKDYTAFQIIDIIKRFYGKK